MGRKLPLPCGKVGRKPSIYIVDRDGKNLDKIVEKRIQSTDVVAGWEKHSFIEE